MFKTIRMRAMVSVRNLSPNVHRSRGNYAVTSNKEFEKITHRSIYLSDGKLLN
ncbi:MAG: hypothetical protein KJ666_13935 [Bacteroidetes bacterium]|nr:hypothetical protein [Bacteroidota bacterium]